VRIKPDEDLPVSLAAGLTERGHDVESVAEEGLVGAPDPAVLDAAISEKRMMFTLDRGFSGIRPYPPGSHPGIVVLRIDDQSARAVARTALALVDGHSLEDLVGTVTIAQHGGFRVRRPLP
jgi:predicted nuclease of predicted toxin-antitoxin system